MAYQQNQHQGQEQQQVGSIDDFVLAGLSQAPRHELDDTEELFGVRFPPAAADLSDEAGFDHLREFLIAEKEFEYGNGNGNADLNGNQDVAGNQDLQGNQDVNDNGDLNVNENEDFSGNEHINGSEGSSSDRDSSGSEHDSGDENVNGNKNDAGTEDLDFASTMSYSAAELAGFACVDKGLQSNGLHFSNTAALQNIAPYNDNGMGFYGNGMHLNSYGMNMTNFSNAAMLQNNTQFRGNGMHSNDNAKNFNNAAMLQNHAAPYVGNMMSPIDHAFDLNNTAAYDHAAHFNTKGMKNFTNAAPNYTSAPSPYPTGHVRSRNTNGNFTNTASAYPKQAYPAPYAPLSTSSPLPFPTNAYAPLPASRARSTSVPPPEPSPKPPRGLPATAQSAGAGGKQNNPDMYKRVRAMANFPGLEQEKKFMLLEKLPEVVLDGVYAEHMAVSGLKVGVCGVEEDSGRQSAGGQQDFGKPSGRLPSGRQPPIPQPHPVVKKSKVGVPFVQQPFVPSPASVAASLSPQPDMLTEQTYKPLVNISEFDTDPKGLQPIYPAYAGTFTTSKDAKDFRKRMRVPPKNLATDLERVKRYGRKHPCLKRDHEPQANPPAGQYWVRKLYEAMIDISSVADGDSSIHRQRFTDSAVFDPDDLEAVAHHIFDSALAVHERGWVRPSVYHKKVVRGKLTDVSEKSLESRLVRICLCLKQKKATVDDAMRGGVTLALLCDNPDARGFTKLSNNNGNKKRGERLKQAREQREQSQQGGKQDQQGQQDQDGQEGQQDLQDDDE